VSDSLIKGAVEKVESWREHYDVAPRDEVTGCYAHLVFVILNVLQDIDINDRIRALLGEIG